MAYRNKIQDKNSGLAFLSQAYVAMEDLLKNARYAIATRSTTQINDLVTATQNYLGPAKDFKGRLNCGSLSKLYKALIYNMCTLSAPISEKLLGALIFG